VIHCAGRASDVGWPREFRRANFDSVVNLGLLCRETGISRLVFVSTTDVYGLRDFCGEAEDELPLDTSARNPYPRYKIRAEQWLRANLPPARYAIIRPAAVWGEGDPTLTPRFRAFLASSPYIVHFGRWRGQNRWPLADVRTVAAANCLAAVRPEAAGQAINVLDSDRTTIEAFYRQLAAQYFPDRRFRSITLPYACGAALGGAISLLSNLLNLRHPFADPSLYALRSVSHNLDFSNARLRSLFAQAGEAL
jgi:nucleoside-diphosphate-sugar epimerase